MEHEVCDFAALINPVSAEVFFAQHWEHKPLLLQRGEESYYNSLLSIGDIEAFITRGGARYPALRLAKEGAFYAAEAYTRDVKYGDEVFHGVLDVEKIFTEYSAGATVTLPALHRAWPPLGRLCTQLEAQLDHSVHTNAYLTPGRAAGFTPHYDTHEVFVLQIAGSKRWRVYPPPLSLPHRSQPFSPETYTLPDTPLLEFDLSAGDLLYLPRGYVHTTSTAQGFSAHVTIGVSVYTWVELLSELIQDSIQSPEFRRALPSGFAHQAELDASMQRQFMALVDQMRAALEPDVLIERFRRRVRAARPRPATQFRADVAPIGPNSLLRVTPGRDYTISQEHGDLVLHLEGRRVRLQSAVAPALAAISQADSFTPQGLPTTISLDARLALVRYLHGLGFLQSI